MKLSNAIYQDKEKTVVSVDVESIGNYVCSLVNEDDNDITLTIRKAIKNGDLDVADYVEPTVDVEDLATKIRMQRNNLLKQTDYLMMSDYPIESDRLAKVKIYRQALRDIPEQSGFPRTITWPEKP